METARTWVQEAYYGTAMFLAYEANKTFDQVQRMSTEIYGYCSAVYNPEGAEEVWDILTSERDEVRAKFERFVSAAGRIFELADR